ncbi:MAG: hypothetical protein ACHQM6_03955 [Candidatus Kapaibacterium sp.]
MTSGLENKIIAYFDGELSDADSAELLHMASVSPEIRDLFREHEMLRELAHEATRSAVVSSQVESSLFSRIHALAEEPALARPILVFSRRTAVLSLLTIVLISGSLGYLLPKFFSTSPVRFTSTAQITSVAKPVGNPSVGRAPDPVAAQAVASIIGMFTAQKSKHFRLLQSDDLNPSFQDDQVVEPPHIDQSLLREIYPALVQGEDIHSDIGKEKFSPFDLSETQVESTSKFEASLQTSSGFTYPADATPIKPFADQRFSLAYHITENNLVGFRLGSGLYQQLGNVSRHDEGGVEVLNRGIETKRSFSEELFVSHLVPLFFVAPFTLEFSIGGGLIPNGYTIGFEAGFRIPLSETFSFDAAFALSRVHSNALSSQEIINSESAGMKPVVLDGIDIHNTLNGRLHYGIIYRF